MDGVFLNRIICRIAITFLVVSVLLAFFDKKSNAARKEDIQFCFADTFHKPVDEGHLFQLLHKVQLSFLDSLKDALDLEQAKLYLQSHLPNVERLACYLFRRSDMEWKGSSVFFTDVLLSYENANFAFPWDIYQSMRMFIENFFFQ